VYVLLPTPDSEVDGPSMLTDTTRLGASHMALMDLLRSASDLREGAALTKILQLLRDRRTMDLTDLPPADQADLIASRTQELLPLHRTSRRAAGRRAHRAAAARGEVRH